MAYLTGVRNATILTAVLLAVAVCTWQAFKAPSNSRPATESWAQDNLKRNDAGCPTAIYEAPGGELRLCRP
jgi:hypothetical protein